jgi:hypothetical protein
MKSVHTCTYITIAIWVSDMGVLTVRLWRCLGLTLGAPMPNTLSHTRASSVLGPGASVLVYGDA